VLSFLESKILKTNLWIFAEYSRHSLILLWKCWIANNRICFFTKLNTEHDHQLQGILRDIYAMALASENAGHENAAQNCNDGKCGTMSYGKSKRSYCHILAIL